MFDYEYIHCHSIIIIWAEDMKYLSQTALLPDQIGIILQHFNNPQCTPNYILIIRKWCKMETS